MHQFAVVDGMAPECRLGHIGLLAELGYLAQDLWVFHRLAMGRTGGQLHKPVAPTAHFWEVRGLLLAIAAWMPGSADKFTQSA